MNEPKPPSTTAGYFGSSDLIPFGWLRLLAAQYAARLVCAGGINRFVALLNVLNDPVLVHNERSSPGEPVVLVVDAVSLGDFSKEVAQQGEGHADFFGEFLVGDKAVHADAEDLGIGCVEFGDIRLICL